MSMKRNMRKLVAGCDDGDYDDYDDDRDDI